MITLYSTNCPKCKVLETKMKAKNVNYIVCTDIETMTSKGIKSAPVVQLDDSSFLNFGDAVKWVNAL